MNSKSKRSELVHPPILPVSTNAALLVIAIVSFVLMAAFAGKGSLWWDDLWTITCVQKGRSFSEAFDIMLSDAHAVPPLFYIIAYFWMRVAPYGTAWLKLPSMVFAAAGVFVCGLNAKRLCGDRVAVFAAMFAGTSYFLITQGALTYRAYGLMFLLVNLLLWFYIRRGSDAGRERLFDILAYGLAMALLFYTHYYGLIVAAGFFLCDLYLLIRKRIRFRCGVSYMLAGVLFSPLLVYAAMRLMERGGSFWPAVPTVAEIWVLLVKLFGDSMLLLVLFFVMVIVLFFGKALPYFKEYFKDKERLMLSQFSFVSLFVLVVVIIYSRFINPSGSIFVRRYFVSILPMVLIVAAAGLEFVMKVFLGHFSQSRYQQAFFVILAALTISLGTATATSLYYAPYPHGEPYEQAIEWIYGKEEAHGSGAALVTNALLEGIDYYITHDGARPGFNVVPGSRFGTQGYDAWEIVYRFDGHGELPGRALAFLEQQYDLVEHDDDLDVYVYRRK
ncbi:MAG: glycosyltransferase family 39 protein [Oscillospiraceae bacterium]|nr:glycosyltransferase family 39 protein [Oscillospiraceae bacterium]